VRATMAMANRRRAERGMDDDERRRTLAACGMIRL
jgi:hypothetical protein